MSDKVTSLVRSYLVFTCYAELHQLSDLDFLVCESLSEDWRGLRPAREIITRGRPVLLRLRHSLTGQGLGDVQHGGGGHGPHTVDGVAPVDGDGLLHVGGEGQHVARPDLLAVLVPPEGGRGDPHHLALQRDRPLLGEARHQLLQEDGGLVTLGNWEYVDDMICLQ